MLPHTHKNDYNRSISAPPDGLAQQSEMRQNDGEGRGRGASSERSSAGRSVIRRTVGHPERSEGSPSICGEMLGHVQCDKTPGMTPPAAAFPPSF
jgi:hypothetical protein